MRIVKAAPEDAFIVAALSLQLAIDIDGAREVGYLDRAADHWLRHHRYLPTWIAEHEGQHAGYLQGVLPPETTWPGERPGTRGRLWVQALHVSAPHRRQGIARALTSACEAWSKDVGVGVIRLRCHPGAEEFYDAAGYLPATQVREKRLRPLR